VSPLLPRFLYRWPAYWQELWAERAAIMEFQGGMSREQAEKKAEEDIRWQAQDDKRPVQQEDLKHYESESSQATPEGI
jgi:hypothetical protein